MRRHEVRAVRKQEHRVIYRNRDISDCVAADGPLGENRQAARILAGLSGSNDILCAVEISTHLRGLPVANSSAVSGDVGSDTPAPADSSGSPTS